MLKGAARWGHFAASRWSHDGAEVHELFIAAEGLNRPVAEVFATLLHEAAHVFAHQAGVKDTSRGGRYHNAQFKTLGEHMGLTITEQDPIGWSGTELAEGTAARYAAPMAKLAEALDAFRLAEAGKTARKSSNNGVVLVCGCDEPRKIRMSLAAAEVGPIRCRVCSEDFSPAE
jgi:hypothetical protein